MELFQSWETAESSAKDLQKPQPQSERIQLVSKVKRHIPTTNDRQKGSSIRCGGHYQSSECRFKTAICNSCKKRGHIACACLSRSKLAAQPKSSKSDAQQHSDTNPFKHRTDETSDEQLQPKADEGSETTYSLFTLSRNHRSPIIVTVAQLDMEVDIGATHSLISESTFKQLPSYQLCNHQKCSCVHILERNWQFLAASQLNSTHLSAAVEILVVQGDGPSLLGRDILDEIRLDWTDIYRLQSQPTQALDAILDRHQALFGQELGKITGVKATIYIKANEKPHFLPC